MPALQASLLLRAWRIRARGAGACGLRQDANIRSVTGHGVIAAGGKGTAIQVAPGTKYAAEQRRSGLPCTQLNALSWLHKKTTRASHMDRSQVKPTEATILTVIEVKAHLPQRTQVLKTLNLVILRQLGDHQQKSQAQVE